MADNLIKLAFAILGAVLTYGVIPYIRAKKSREEREALAESIRIAVQAAEQIYSQAGKGQEKKAYVIKWLIEQGIDTTGETVGQLIDAMIESTVLELKKEG